MNAFTDEQFKNINGFSNLFFGWGGEGKEKKMSSFFYQVISNLEIALMKKIYSIILLT